MKIVLLKNKINIFIFSFIGIFLFVDCGKKYPDDPFITPRSSKRRLQYKAGDPSQWNIVTVKVNGVDMTQAFNDSLQPHKFSDIHFRFVLDFWKKFEGVDGYTFVYINYWNFNGWHEKSEVAAWYSSINSKRKNLLFYRLNDPIYINDTIAERILYNLLAVNWEVRRLYGKYMVIKQTKFGKEYEVVFKR
ncbi:MAG: hypothetical protein JNM96_03590 [Bacteroidia bacterium]|nr:hypothetical protein [Bacteroidia bacterium]